MTKQLVLKWTIAPNEGMTWRTQHNELCLERRYSCEDLEKSKIVKTKPRRSEDLMDIKEVLRILLGLAVLRVKAFSFCKRVRFILIRIQERLASVFL